MFTVIKFLPEEKSIRGRIKSALGQDIIRKNYVCKKGFSPFLVCEVKILKKGIDWNRISASLNESEKTLLFNKDYLPPACLGFKTFNGNNLETMLMYKFFTEVMQEIKNRGKINVSFYDRKGVLCNYLEKIIMFVSQITVYTDEIRQYFFSSQKIMEEYGATVKIRDYDEKSNDEFIMADKYDYLKMGEARLAFCGNADIIYDNVVSGKGITLGEDIMSVKPDFVESLSFAAALYELNGAKMLLNESFSKIMLFGKDVSLRDIRDLALSDT